VIIIFEAFDEQREPIHVITEPRMGNAIILDQYHLSAGLRITQCANCLATIKDFERRRG
jgi:hypothetical protein